MKRALFFTSVVLALGAVFAQTRALDAPSSVQLYALDGGTIAHKDLSMFSDTGDYDGKAGTLPAPAFLVRHPKGTLLWDTGIGDELAKQPAGFDIPAYGIHMSVQTPIATQLAQLGLAPKDVQYVAFSHLHGDHTGNAGLFTGATWIVTDKELQWATAKPTPVGVNIKSIAAFKRVKRDRSEFDVDVFGDGTVRILRAPGHTPDHRVLMLKLAKAGTVLLSGDLYHLKDSAKYGRVPFINHNRADTLASFDRVAKLIKQHDARLIVQHAMEDFTSLPKFPAYLD